MLVVEDDPQVASLVQAVLERADHEVVAAADGRDGLRAFFEQRPALVVLDVDLPGVDGWTVLERIRELSDTPVLMLTGHSGELDKVRAFKAGADQYLTKPFGTAELAARVEVLLRRTGGSRDVDPEVLDDGVVRIDFAARCVAILGEEVRLTPTEFRLLAALVRHPGQVLSRSQLQELVWGEAGLSSGDEVRVYIGYLRRKLGDAPIETVRGFGYRYAPDALRRAAQVR